MHIFPYLYWPEKARICPNLWGQSDPLWGQYDIFYNLFSLMILLGVPSLSVRLLLHGWPEPDHFPHWDRQLRQQPHLSVGHRGRCRVKVTDRGQWVIKLMVVSRLQVEVGWLLSSWWGHGYTYGSVGHWWCVGVKVTDRGRWVIEGVVGLR